MGKDKIAAPRYAEDNIASGDFQLFGELSQNRRGAYVQITDVLAGTVGGTIQIPVTLVGAVLTMLDNLAAGMEDQKMAMSEDKSLQVVALTDPKRGPMARLHVNFGDRCYTITFPSGMIPAVKEMVTKLAEKAVGLEPLPPAPPKEQRPREQRQDRKPQVSGTGNLARPIGQPRRDDRKPQQSSGLEKKLDKILAQQTEILALLRKLGVTQTPLTVALPEMGNRDKVDAVPEEEDWEKEAARERARTAVIEGTPPPEAPLIPPASETAKEVEAIAIATAVELDTPPTPAPTPAPVAAPAAPEAPAPVEVSVPAGQTVHVSVDPQPLPSGQCSLCGKTFPAVELVKVDKDDVCTACKAELDEVHTAPVATVEEVNAAVAKA
jgi:hypothetical protein